MLVRFLVVFALVSMFVPSVVMGHGSHPDADHDMEHSHEKHYVGEWKLIDGRWTKTEVYVNGAGVGEYHTHGGEPNTWHRLGERKSENCVDEHKHGNGNWHSHTGDIDGWNNPNAQKRRACDVSHRHASAEWHIHENAYIGIKECLTKDVYQKHASNRDSSDNYDESDCVPTSVSEDDTENDIISTTNTIGYTGDNVEDDEIYGNNMRYAHNYTNEEGERRYEWHVHKDVRNPDDNTLFYQRDSHHTPGGVNGEGHDGSIDPFPEEDVSIQKFEDSIVEIKAVISETEDFEDHHDGGGRHEGDGRNGVKHDHCYENQSSVVGSSVHYHKDVIVFNGVYAYVPDSHHSRTVNGEVCRVNGEGYDDWISDSNPNIDCTGFINVGCGDEVVPPVPPVTPVTPVDPVTPVTTVTNSRSETVTVIPIPTKDSVVPEEVIKKVVQEEVVEEEPVELVRFEYGYWYQGLNFVSFPVLPEGVETVKDLFERYELFESFQLVSQDPFEYTGDAIYVVIDGSWLSYGGEEDNPIGDIVITPYMGFVLLMDYSIWLGITGNRLIGDGTYELQIGMNLLGITEMPVDINKPSDFLLVDGVSAVISRVITDLGINKNWYVVSSVGDPGDEYPVVLGHAYVLIAESAGGLIDFDGDIDVPAAPAANRVGKLNTSWGSIKVK